MAPRRNRLSEAEYKKIAKLKEFNLNKIVQKTIKIDTMFKNMYFIYVDCKVFFLGGEGGGKFYVAHGGNFC